MKRYLPSLLLLLLLPGCEKEEQNSHRQFLQEHIFNGSSQWIITRMEADTEREINGQSTTLWSEQFPACRKDNVYQFGALGVKIASINIVENNSSCSLEEPELISQGLVLDFSSDFNKANVFIKGDAMVKLYDLSNNSRVTNFDFEHSWEIEEVSPERLVVKAFIPAEQSGGMVEQPATVYITFERNP
jgi:hypothetical protein